MINIELYGTDYELFKDVILTERTHGVLEIITHDNKRYEITPLNACSDLEQHELDEYTIKFDELVRVFEKVQEIKLDIHDGDVTICFDLSTLLLNCSNENCVYYLSEYCLN